MVNLFGLSCEEWKVPASPSITECSSPVSSLSSDYTSLESVFSDGDDFPDAVRVDEVLVSLADGMSKQDSARKRRAEAIQRRNKRRGLGNSKKPVPEPKTPTIYSTAKSSRSQVRSASPTLAAERKEERLIKNRESAALSRLRKRQELEDLRRMVEELTAANKNLTNRVQELEQENEQLRASQRITPLDVVQPDLSLGDVLSWVEEGEMEVLLDGLEFTEALQCSLESKALERLGRRGANYKCSRTPAYQLITLSLTSEKPLLVPHCERRAVMESLSVLLSRNPSDRLCLSSDWQGDVKINLVKCLVTLINYLCDMRGRPFEVPWSSDRSIHLKF